MRAITIRIDGPGKVLGEGLAEDVICLAEAVIQDAVQVFVGGCAESVRPPVRQRLEAKGLTFELAGANLASPHFYLRWSEILGCWRVKILNGHARITVDETEVADQPVELMSGGHVIRLAPYTMHVSVHPRRIGQHSGSLAA